MKEEISYFIIKFIYNYVIHIYIYTLRYDMLIQPCNCTNHYNSIHTRYTSILSGLHKIQVCLLMIYNRCGVIYSYNYHSTSTIMSEQT